MRYAFLITTVAASFYCDYSSGEKMTIDEFTSSRWVAPGVQWFLFTYLGEKWGGSRKGAGKDLSRVEKYQVFISAQDPANCTNGTEKAILNVV